MLRQRLAPAPYTAGAVHSRSSTQSWQLWKMAAIGASPCPLIGVDLTVAFTLSQQTSVAVIGASGYAGGELVRLVDGHPFMTLDVLAGHTSAGRALREIHPQLPDGDRLLTSLEDALEADVELAFLALPHGASAEPAMALLAGGAKVVDLGADFRLRDESTYAAAYGGPHPFPEELGRWPYGLPEINRAALGGADRVAVPGCYPTSAVLALIPAIAGGLIDPESLVVDSMSGASGAGRSAHSHLSYGAIDEGVKAYAVATHRHRPEMEQAIAAATGADASTVRVSFTPHLVPMQRGLLSTCSAPLTTTASADELVDALAKAYADEPFVDVVDAPPLTRWVVGSNRCLISAHVDGHAGRAIVIAALDNLLKGAAGQAMQCANLMLGFPETTGLPIAGWMP